MSRTEASPSSPAAIAESEPHERARAAPDADEPRATETPRSSRRVSTSSRSLVMAMLILMTLVIPWITSFAEWQDYRRSEFLLGRREWSRSELPLVWVFYAKTQLVLLPGLLVSLLLAARRRVNLAQVTMLTWLALVVTWVVIEKQTYTRTNVHALDYLKFVRDPYAVQWAGSMRTMAYGILASLLALTRSFLAAAAVVILIVRLAGWLSRKFDSAAADEVARGRRGRRAFAIVCAVLYVASIVAVVPAQHIYRDRVSLLRTHALLPYNFTWSAVGLELVDTGKFMKPLNRLMADKLRATLPVLRAGAPPDPDAVIPADAPRPNVVLIGVESLRADALAPELMPRLHALAPKSMNLRQHRSGARMTHLGLYSLLFARTPTFYWPTTVAFVPPQASVTFRKSGYDVRYIGSAHHEHWLNMSHYLNEKFFDEITMYADPNWPAMDVKTLARTGEMLRARGGGGAGGGAKPQFILAFLTSTHFPYLYPPEFEKHKPVLGTDWHFLPFDPEHDLQPGINRYRNSVGYMDHLLADFIERTDLSNTVVIITGDHGESLWDDGTMAHGGRWSESQMRVPCLIFGAGVKPHDIDAPTNHMDLLPTALHLAAGKRLALRNTSGVDVLSGDPRPACELLSSESHDSYYEMLVEMRGRRLLVELPSNRIEIIVRGTVEPNGNIDAFNLPPPEDVQMWADGIGDHLERLTQIGK